MQINNIILALSNIIGKIIPCSPSVLLLDYVSLLNLSATEECVYLAGLTAAKKMLALHWKPPHGLLIGHWSNLFMDILHMSDFQWQDCMVLIQEHLAQGRRSLKN